MCHVHLAVVHEVENGLQIAELDAFQVEKRVSVWVFPQNRAKEWRACRKYHFVSLDLIFIAGKGHIKEVLVVPQLPKGNTDVGLKVIPSQTKLLVSHGEMFFSSSDSFR